MRPVMGSGVWINTGVTRALPSLMRPGDKWPVTRAVVDAAQRGVDTLQWRFGDLVPYGADQCAPNARNTETGTLLKPEETGFE